MCLLRLVLELSHDAYKVGNLLAKLIQLLSKAL
jgi:hypothetical protein